MAPSSAFDCALGLLSASDGNTPTASRVALAPSPVPGALLGRLHTGPADAQAYRLLRARFPPWAQPPAWRSGLGARHFFQQCPSRRSVVADDAQA